MWTLHTGRGSSWDVTSADKASPRDAAEVLRAQRDRDYGRCVYPSITNTEHGYFH